MLKSSILTMLLVILVATPMANAVTAGDPLDGNEQPTFSPNIPGCDNAERFPNCVPCWTQCIYAMMADAWNGGDWDWDW